jgi:hypothetical protein
MIVGGNFSRFAAGLALFAIMPIAKPGLTQNYDDASSRLVRISATDTLQAAQGIKEALLTGASNAVAQTGRVNGFFGDRAIKILMPQKLQPIETGLRAIAYGPKIDAFVLSMNRAAEGAPMAKPIFSRAITSMTITDAQRIVSGGSHSATDYFKRKTSGELTAAFTPVVKNSMQQYAVVRQYDDLLGKYQSGPLAMGGIVGGAIPGLDINSYVVQKTLDGLFYVIGQQEEKIRTNPAAQVTPLLRQVFGGLNY